MDDLALIIKSIRSLGYLKFKLDAQPTCKREFDKFFHCIVGTDSIGSAIYGNCDLTWEQVHTKFLELKKEWEDTQYQRDRAPQYPSLADFADAYYWAQKGDNTKMNAYIAQCDEVKNQYPKP